MPVPLRHKLETVYAAYNRKEFVDPDPLMFLYRYPQVRDREIAGLVAACLAYGRVEMILQAVNQVLMFLGPNPRDRVVHLNETDLYRGMAGFSYRFARPAHVVSLIVGIQRVLRQYGSLEACFMTGMSLDDPMVMPGLLYLVRHLDPDGACGHLLADPAKSSACKRSHLFLRWMVRKDQVDPGGWDRVRPSQLLLPLDRHMFSAGKMLGFTRRKTPDRTACLEITDGFRQLNPEDPVKYDFCLTRFGIRRSLAMTDLKAMLAD
ncbi:MAG: TIGR02757 family protein [Desulfotignum sp.]|nr:TIGR02757 family protein [Desulfotignum sp.]MCF8088374.1 TIGR02757 family protein [Desulfotignum sp.]MCF8138722.1 TIGR02757 family protein [Desulfotignum sp.]